MVNRHDVLYIVIYPFPFGDFLWEKYELSELANFVEVEVWDLSNILHHKWRKKISTSRHFNSKILDFNNSIEFLKYIKKFRLLNRKGEIYISYHLAGNTLKEFLITQVVKIYLNKLKTLYIRNNLQGIPLPNKINRDTFSLTWFKKEFRKIVSNPINFGYRLKSLIFETLSSKFKLVYSFYVISGDSYQKQFTNQFQGGINIVSAHSLDYSNYLLFTESDVSKKSKKNRHIVFLDIGFPHSVGDSNLTRQKTALSSVKWYQKLNDLFAILEKQFNLKVIICGHYKTNYASPSQIFNGREVIYNRTIELVSNSQFVITMGSSAVSYAVIYKKPVIFITSNTFKFSIVDKSIRDDFEQMAYELESDIVNLDHLPLNFEPLLSVNNEKYYSYFFKYMTSRRDTIPNFRIILKEIINLEQS